MTGHLYKTRVCVCDAGQCRLRNYSLEDGSLCLGARSRFCRFFAEPGAAAAALPGAAGGRLVPCALSGATRGSGGSSQGGHYTGRR